MDARGMTDVDPTRPGPMLLAEAALALGAGAAARLLVPFPILARRLARSPQAGIAATADEIRPIRRAIDAWTRRLPVEPRCFARGLAAFWMLRRRGRAPRLYYGAATIEGKLKAHVWVRSGDHDVVGCDIADQYALLAAFPEPDGANYVSKG
jgi:hypothetical protein